jgi:hypothetical protein
LLAPEEWGRKASKFQMREPGATRAPVARGPSGVSYRGGASPRAIVAAIFTPLGPRAPAFQIPAWVGIASSAVAAEPRRARVRACACACARACMFVGRGFCVREGRPALALTCAKALQGRTRVPLGYSRLPSHARKRSRGALRLPLYSPGVRDSGTRGQE